MKRPWIPIAAVALQAGLLFTNLNLLPLWGDEVFTLRTVAHPLGEIPAIVAADIHPPLYFLLLHLWPSHAPAALRAFSGVWALLATLLLDYFWTARWRPLRRLCALLFFALSPCLLLYGRMARSYSMQAALFLLAASLLWRWHRQRHGAVPAFLALAALFYTHYVPGLALLGAFGLVALPRLGLRRLATFGTLVAVVYAPWLWTLAGALLRWSSGSGFSAHYQITGSAWREQFLKLAFGAVSLSLGETFHPLTILLVPCIAWLVYRAARRTPLPLAVILAVAAAVGYIGAARWVTYPFIGARLLWLLPFLALAVAIGMGRSRVIAGVLLLASSASTIYYFRRENYLDMGYHAPVREVAARLRAEAAAQDDVFVDSFDTDPASLAYYLGDRVAPHPLTDVEGGGLPAAATIWILRNPRAGRESALEDRACGQRERQVTSYLPYTAWQRALLARLTPDPPAYWYQLTRCRLTPTSSR